MNSYLTTQVKAQRSIPLFLSQPYSFNGVTMPITARLQGDVQQAMNCTTGQQGHILPRLVTVMRMADESSKAVAQPFSSSTIWTRHVNIKLYLTKVSDRAPEAGLPVYILSKPGLIRLICTVLP